MLCSECSRDFPEELLSPVFVRGEYSPKVCGICALKIINAVQGTNMNRFAGGLAEKNRLAAVGYLIRAEKRGYHL